MLQKGSFRIISSDTEGELEDSRDTLASETETSAGPDVCQVEPAETLVFFDLETTGLDQSCEIVQLSAVSGEKLFDKYILPMSECASVNGMRVVDGTLFLRGKPQPTSSLQEAMAAFLKFLQSVSRPVLIGHNIWRFDCSVIHRVWEKLSMKDQFNECIVGFLDTLWLAKNMISRRAVKSYSLHHLVFTCVRKDFVAKNSLEEVKILQELYSVLNPSPEQTCNAQFSLSQFECRLSLQPLLDQKIISNPILVQLAKQEISLEKIKSAHQEDPRCGVQKLLYVNGNTVLSRPELTIRKIRAFLRVKSLKDRKLDSMWWNATQNVK
ncbi:protein PML-like [Callorhinchus milii]|nr:protein PML-like [Callorhinchus milii]